MKPGRSTARAVTGLGFLAMTAAVPAMALAQQSGGGQSVGENQLMQPNDVTASGSATYPNNENEQDARQQAQASETGSGSGTADRTRAQQQQRQQKRAPANTGNQQRTLPGADEQFMQDQEKAFNRALRSLSSLTPSQIKRLKRYISRQRKAEAQQPSGVPEPRIGSEVVELGTGMQPRTLKLTPNFATTIAFRDATGQPWPVESVVKGSPDELAITRPRESGSSLTITPTKRYPVTNIFVYLHKMTNPLVFRVRRAEDKRDSRVMFRVPKPGPEAQGSTQTQTSVDRPPKMLAFLDNTPPEGARELETSNDEVTAWRYNDGIYLRVERGMTVLSPDWGSTMRGAGDVRVYHLETRPPVVLGSLNGEIVEIKIST